MSEYRIELLGELFRNASEGIMVFNQRGEIEILNPRSEEMFGYSEKELTGKKAEVLVPEKARARHINHRHNYMKNPGPISMSERTGLMGLRKDGSMFPIEISLNHIRHQDRMLIVTFITDITVRKENEATLEKQRQKIKEYAGELEKKVQSRTSELEHMNLGLQSQIQERKLAESALKQSLEDLKNAKREIIKSLEREKELSELKSRFVSIASHEFRTPLTTILSSANLITKYERDDQQASREKHINRIEKSVRNLTSILNDFLSLEKLESGSQNVENHTFDLRELCLEILEEMSPALKAGQEVTFDVPSFEIFSDEHVLKNILINLISNASKYSHENDLIDLKARATNDQVAIEVRDRGIGIPEQEQKNLFKRFFRAGNVTNIQGTGLGLNIVRKYIELLGGEITFSSKEGKGSLFSVVVPL